eukprot:Phypoly_transcript_02498.p1 GENE.Phypoly_transcript_02498~~Phypoly_transcript_02498.p1  ORF type:complete len:848 (+),score=179.01 Phypoly_transcript_02498:118-2661(+)
MSPTALLAVFAILLSLSSAYTVSRNVKDYGAQGNGVTDDTNAIITALTQGRASDPNAQYPSATYPDSTQTPAYVFFPAGTYLVTQTLPVVYYTQMVGDPANPPTIKFVNNGQVRVLDAFGPWYPGSQQGTDNFYRMIRNFVIDMTSCNQCTGLHWQVAQATSITNVHFKCAIGSQCQGIWMENGSGGFFSDLVFEGGIYGLWVGNQQFTSRNITIRDTSMAAVYMNWNWLWSFKGLHISNSPVGIDTGTGESSIVVLDSDFTNVPIAVRTQKSTTNGQGSLYLENVKYAGSGTIVQLSGANVLTSSGSQTVKAWAQGYLWQNGGNTLGIIDLSAQTPARPASLVKSDGTYFEQTRPLFAGFTQIDVTTLGLRGDGVTDNTVALQNALNAHVGSVLFFPYGTYLIGNTVVVPPGSRLLGQAWTNLQASGSAFQNANAPIPMLQIGNPGQTGVAQIVDFMIGVKGPQPGAKLIEWNLHDPANAPGSNGLWDVHYRVGGAVGTGLQANNCPNDDGSNSPASRCSGAWALLHITSYGNAYLENVWGWVADHDIDQGGQVNIYNARGFLCESQGPTWGYGTAFEHSVLYQYNIYNAKNVFLAAIQTETPYYQPSTKTPFNPSEVTDPSYCANDARCKMAYALAIQSSSWVYIYGSGTYSFFNVWSTSCLPTSCQSSIIYISNTNNVYHYSINTYGGVNTYSFAPSYAIAANNPNTLLASGIVNVNLFGPAAGSSGSNPPPPPPPPTTTTTGSSSSSNPPSSGYLVSKANGNYVTVNSGAILVATANSAASATQFAFAAIPSGYSIQSKSTNLYASANDAGASPLEANRDTTSHLGNFRFRQIGKLLGDPVIH